MIKNPLYNLLLLLIFFFAFQSCSKTVAKSFDYGNVSPYDYLIGKFTPSKHSLFVNLRKFGIHVDEKQHYLRIEAAKALKRMYAEFHKQHPEVNFKVRSTTRNFDAQKSIWERKWKSKRYNRLLKSPLKKALNILKYSSMPGTSRHHWGTDFDINSLSNDYYSYGEGKIIYNWLKLNASRFGFCQPYNKGRKAGYMEEKWHWSYFPVSEKLQKEWNRLIGKNDKKIYRKIRFLGYKEAWHLSKKYVNSVNNRCF